MSDPSDLSVEILKQIRDEIVHTRTDLGTLIAETNTRIDQTNTRLDKVEHALLDLAEQQRFVVRHLQTLSGRDRALEEDVDELRTRVDVIEKRLDEG